MSDRVLFPLTVILVLIIGVTWTTVLVNIARIERIKTTAMKNEDVAALWRQFFAANPQLTVPPNFIPFRE